MPQKNIIINSLRESISSIWKNKSLFILLFILQIVFFAILFFVSQNYLPKMLENAKAISDYLSQQKLDEISMTQNILQQKNILGDDPLSISRNFNEMAKNFRIYLAYIFILLIVFLSVFWTLTNRLVYKETIKQLRRYFFKVLIVLLFYLGLIFSFFYSIFNISFTEAAYEPSKIFAKYLLFLVASLILVYFMFISISLVDRTGFKNIVQKTLTIGIKKTHYILSVYFINIFLLIFSIGVLSYFIDNYFFIALISLLLMFFSFIFGRIFLINVVEKLD